ncbi:acyl-CoA thioesterase [Dermatophilus congolensis]|uniref:Uncharacterized protein n=1 Tax=Dermatophilus congolensis TaxID=1863 RepID=A0A239VJH6_9MICO|nr:thioesterase family protein [Dermatophilus congolensis]MBO3129136.1 hypothetical protein [Dermatophilus congolensis]MBO3132227.1 hypothetical protein [Dermatophilus congolensis]MBO3133612.1 hypothetical protein [Dermatophilus congolensis]MBO3135845.1 hypothetical protein [Dermatophilus congolensis]MBO3138087.1 hypothetical protein [Dermatophilus congolensis]
MDQWSAPANAARVEVPLRFSDMDALGHINNIAFISIMQEARIEAFDRWGAEDLHTWRYLVVKHEVEYFVPLAYAVGVALVDVWIERVGNSSVKTVQVVRSVGADGGEVVHAAMVTTSVYVSESGESSMRIGDEARAVLCAHMAAGVREGER